MPVVCMQDVFQVACTCMHAKVFFASYKQSKGILLCNVNNQNEVYLYTVNKDVVIFVYCVWPSLAPVLDHSKASDCK